MYNYKDDDDDVTNLWSIDHGHVDVFDPRVAELAEDLVQSLLEGLVIRDEEEGAPVGIRLTE